MTQMQASHWHSRQEEGERSIAGDIPFIKKTKAFPESPRFPLGFYLSFICHTLDYSTPSLLWQGVDFADLTNFGLGHVTCFRQQNVSRYDAKALNVFVGFGWTPDVCDPP